MLQYVLRVVLGVWLCLGVFWAVSGCLGSFGGVLVRGFACLGLFQGVRGVF